MVKELSLQLYCRYSYDGVPIAIGMKVETKEGEGTTFIIQLSIS